MPLKKLKSKTFKWQDYVLIAILVVSFFLSFWMLYKEGYSNEYYAAAVKSMLSNAKAFFYGSFDSGLYVTVDKPPLGLWIQALSAAIFGVNSFGLILPSALAGSMCALLVYSMVKKYWGDTAGIISAAIMATTPILVALSRTNNMDMLLLFFLLCGAKFILKASQKQSLKYYIIAMIFLGLGFNVKMLQAFMVLPAFVLVYFFGKGKLSKKLAHTFVAVCVLAVVSFSWAVYVDSVPESERPYIGSSSTNSVFNLIVGYNGLNRLTGQQGGGNGNILSLIESADKNFSSEDGSLPMEIGDSSYFSGQVPDNAQNGEISSAPNGANDGSGTAPQMDGANNSDNVNRDGNNSSDGMTRGYDLNGIFDNIGNAIGSMNGGGGAGGESESGTRGIFRLYSTQLSGLISWFLLPAITMVVFAIACCVQWFRKRKTFVLSDENRDKLNSIIFWSAWLVPMAVFFSIGGFIHRYYVVMLCPAIAALTAIAAKMIWQSKHRKWFVPVGFLATLAVQCIIAFRTSWAWIVIPMLIVAAIGTIFFFLQKAALQKIAAVLMLISLFIAPLAWSLTPVFYTNNSTIPNAGPDLAGNSGRNDMGFNASNSAKSDTNSALDEFLLENYNGERWAIAVSSSSDAAPIILETGLPVMAIGGFSGSDSILTLDKLKEYVADGELRYYYASSNRGGGSSEISSWVTENGKAVELSDGTTIYDLSGAAD